MPEKLTPQQKKDRATKELVVRTLMAQSEGRRYLWLQLENCNVFEAVMTFGPNILAVTAFNEGKRSLGLALLSDIVRLCPREYVLMAEESNRPVENQDDGYDADSLGE